MIMNGDTLPDLGKPIAVVGSRTFGVYESDDPDGLCKWGAKPEAVLCTTYYDSTKLIEGEDGSYTYGDLGVDMDEVWNNDEEVSDGSGHRVLVCENAHYYVNPNARVE